MIQWTIYERPKDYPEGYIARCWLVAASGIMDTGRTLTAPTLEKVRELVRADYPSGHRLPRFTNDDPVIVEVWI